MRQEGNSQRTCSKLTVYNGNYVQRHVSTGVYSEVYTALRIHLKQIVTPME